MELIFLRHAQPEWVIDGKGLTDPPLTPLGREQAQRLAERALSWRRPTEILVSPLLRSQQTAEPLCQALGITPITIDWLIEMKMPPSLDGAPEARINELFQRMRRRPPAAWWEGMPDGGERFDDFYRRVTESLKALLEARGAWRPEPEAHPSLWQVEEAAPERRLVFVGHGGSNSAAINFLLGIEPVPWPWERFVSYHASVSRLRSSAVFTAAHLFGLRLLSDVSHLPAEMQTR